MVWRSQGVERAPEDMHHIYVAPVPNHDVVAALVEALERVADHPESGTVLTDYDATGKQRVWPTVEDIARTALAAYRAAMLGEQ
jgi:hypothetical protein